MSLVRRGAMTKETYSAERNKVTKVFLYYKPHWIEFLFLNILGGPRILNYICRTLRNSCKTVHKYDGSPSISQCVRMLRRLPSFTSSKHFDGPDLSCRALHAAYARTNPVHCAHISFLPLKDPNGQMKCQKSALMPILTGLTASDIVHFKVCFTAQ